MRSDEESTHIEVLYTFPQWDCDKRKENPVPDPSLLDSPVVYDVLGFDRGLPPMELTCPSQMRYTAASPGKAGAFCRHSNVPVPYNNHPDVVLNSCFQKCAERRRIPTLREVRNFPPRVRLCWRL